MRKWVQPGYLVSMTYRIKVPAKTLQELIGLVKAAPGKYNYSDTSSSGRLAAELFKLRAGNLDIVPVPYRGLAPALQDVHGGRVQIIPAIAGAASKYHQEGVLRVLSVFNDKRLGSLPDVPTAAEGGVPGYQAANWIGIVAPAGTPEPVVALLHKEISAIQDSSELKQRFAAEGVDVMRMSVPEFGAFMVSETAKWGKVVKDANIKAE